ncbi:hypothetical protein [Rhizobium azibense]|uniref:hypothetical protein n=1 Tax=Rhizobium azibense TaxID=1136135 RepID=UPI001FDF14A9|nr:hypothetical protein [Rhizobium azibense]
MPMGPFYHSLQSGEKTLYLGVLSQRAHLIKVSIRYISIKGECLAGTRPTSIVRDSTPGLEVAIGCNGIEDWGSSFAPNAGCEAASIDQPSLCGFVDICGHLQGVPHGFTSDNLEETPALDDLSAAVTSSDQRYLDYLRTEAAALTFTDSDKGYMTREEMLTHVVLRPICRKC